MCLVCCRAGALPAYRGSGVHQRGQSCWRAGGAADTGDSAGHMVCNIWRFGRAYGVQKKRQPGWCVTSTALLEHRVCRGRGVGAELLRHVIRDCPHDIYLVTLASTVPFYAAAGFVQLPRAEIPWCGAKHLLLTTQAPAVDASLLVPLDCQVWAGLAWSVPIRSCLFRPRVQGKQH